MDLVRGRRHSRGDRSVNCQDLIDRREWWRGVRKSVAPHIFSISLVALVVGFLDYPYVWMTLSLIAFTLCVVGFAAAFSMRRLTRAIERSTDRD